MATVTITTRHRKNGPRYVVRYRLGGRAYPIVHAGAFKTLKDAKARRDLVAGEIADGRNPAELLRTAAQCLRCHRRSSRDLGRAVPGVSDRRRREHEEELPLALHKKIGETFGDRDPATITATEIAEWIADLAETRKPGTLGQYLIAFRLLLDHVGSTRTPPVTRG